MGNYLTEYIAALWRSLAFFSDLQGVITLVIAIFIILFPSLVPLKEIWRKKRCGISLNLFGGRVLTVGQQLY